MELETDLAVICIGLTDQIHKITLNWKPINFYSASHAFRVNLLSVIVYMPRTHCWKQAGYLKFKWLQQDSNPQPFKS